MRKQVEERTCDLCGSQANSEAGRDPIGWMEIAVTADGRAVVENRDICPFCWEAMETCLINAKVRQNRKEGAK